jgi:hypothetical protein
MSFTFSNPTGVSGGKEMDVLKMDILDPSFFKSEETLLSLRIENIQGGGISVEKQFPRIIDPETEAALEDTTRRGG